jgi:hypothetical protein
MAIIGSRLITYPMNCETAEGEFGFSDAAGVDGPVGAAAACEAAPTGAPQELQKRVPDFKTEPHFVQFVMRSLTLFNWLN